MDTSPGVIRRSNGFADIDRSYNIRIPEEAFIASTAAFLTVALISAAIRTGLRWHLYGSLSADDYILLFSCACLIAVAGVAWTIKDLVYLQIYVGLGWETPAPDFFTRMLVFEKRVVVCSALVWLAIYAVKLAFLLFFRRLVDRIRTLMIHWWIVLGFLVAGACVSVPLAVIICPHYGEDYMAHCSIASQIANEVIYLKTSVVIDIFTDVLLISIPVHMLWGLQMQMRRKLGLGLLLSLSCFMIAIAIIRTTLAPLPNGVIDTSWLVFWQGIEAVVAVLMVSLTAIRGLFATERDRSFVKKKASSGERSSDSEGKLDGSTPAVSERSSKKKNKGVYHEDTILMTNITFPDEESCLEGERIVEDKHTDVVRITPV